jgi:hypothetical protein
MTQSSPHHASLFLFTFAWFVLFQAFQRLIVLGLPEGKEGFSMRSKELKHVLLFKIEGDDGLIES